MLIQDRWRLGLDAVGTIALVITCGVFVVQIRSGSSSDTDSRSGPVQTVKLETKATADAQGQKTAKLAVVEFADFQCPYCGQFAHTTLPALKREFVDSGRVRYMFRHFPLEGIHPFALKASAAAECAGQQQKYWEMHDQLFTSPQQLAEKDLIQYATSLNLNELSFRQCLTTEPKNVKADQIEAARLGVQSTPTFFIGHAQPDGRIELVRRINGAVSYDVFRSAIADLL